VSSAKWRVDGAKVRALRMALMMTLEELARKSGVSDRSIAAIERGDSGARPETIRCLAKALGVAPEELLVRDAPTVTPAPTAASAPTPSESGLPPPKIAARTNLDRLADLTRKRNIAPAPVVVGKARVDVLIPPRMQEIFARHVAFDGKRFVVDGVVERPRALSLEEARALGTKVGVGARYHVLAEIAPGIELSVTAHATNAKLAAALEAKTGQRARIVVTVRVVGKNDARVISLFASTRKRAWAFVVTEVL
jgi:transcriptional regulator with XRE-family HTH domain